MLCERVSRREGVMGKEGGSEGGRRKGVRGMEEGKGRKEERSG